MSTEPLHPNRTRTTTTPWSEAVAKQLTAVSGVPEREAHIWASRAPAEFAGRRSPGDAADDIGLCLTGEPAASLVTTAGGAALRLSWPDRPSLSRLIAVLDRLGVEVRDHTEWLLPGPSGRSHRLDDFAVELGSGCTAPGTDARLVEALIAVVAGRADDDGFNRLVGTAGLDWREASWVRAWYRYLRQTGVPFSLRYVEESLVRYPAAVAALVTLFRTRFHPGVHSRTEAMAGDRAHAVAEIDRVSRRDDARILRAALCLVEATLRTNAFLRDGDGGPLPPLALKVDPSQLDWAPQPRPHREVFVHSPTTEGLHLRATPVSRGGIRWSDRPEDLRTEILGLMKAQQVKNAVIVPGGAKGGFVVRRTTDDPASAAREAYGEFIRGLLDVTDDIVDGSVVRRPGVVAHDDDDTYLVVAADKGTATFSDLANGIAAEYGFWLGDAFASGGSAGFDHKELGITARGAWTSLTRHLGELGLDIRRDSVTVAGIGDMSGDVFGNGMLLSPDLRLVAAFDHRHVFLDPDPDPHASWRERARLAATPRSTWADYDTSVLSPGGAVLARDEASLTLSERARTALGVDSCTLSPDELVRAVLGAPVDVLFNGGVGTYVKASSESHADAGDRARDDQRIDATALRARVVVEGGNLGLTQRARVEYALAGGRINTDFLDNSAGVDTSDREVNLKILLGVDVTAGRMSLEERDRQLSEVTDDVTRAVLEDSAAQARAVSIAEAEAPELLDRHRQLIRVLHAQRRLDPAVEHLPDEQELDRRRATGLGLTRPELALLLAYSKDVTRDALLDSDALDSEHLTGAARTYLPTALRDRAADALRQHPLHREITATVVANEMINRVGSSFIDRLEELTALSTPEVARAYSTVSHALGLTELWPRIEGLDTAVHARTQTALMIALRRLLEEECLWLLHNAEHPLDVGREIDRYRAGAAVLLEPKASFHTAGTRALMEATAQRLQARGCPPDIAAATAALSAPLPVLATVQMSAALSEPVERVAAVHLRLGERLGWPDLLDQASARAQDDHWQHVASAAVRLTIEQHSRALVRQYLTEHPRTGLHQEPPMAAWLDARRPAVGRYLETLGVVRASRRDSLSLLTVATHELGNVRSAGTDRAAAVA